jgi:hypothetical protein
MSDSKNTLKLIAENLLLALKPLQDGVSSVDNFQRLMYSLGWNATSVPASFQQLGTDILAAQSLIDGLSDVPDLSEIEDILELVKKIHDDISGLSELPAGCSSEFLDEIPGRLFNLLLADYLNNGFPQVFAVLSSFGVIENVYTPASGSRPAFLYRKINWDIIPQIISDPTLLLTNMYGWGTDDLNFDLIAKHLVKLLYPVFDNIYIAQAPAAYYGYYQPVESGFTLPGNRVIRIPLYYVQLAGTTEELGLLIMELKADDDHAAGLVIEPAVPSSVTTELALSDTVTLTFKAGTDLASAFGLLVRPDGLSVKYPFEEGTQMPSAGFGVYLKYTPVSSTPLLGNAGETRLELAGASFGLEVNYVSGELELIVSSTLEGLSLVLAGGQGDGFIKKLLGDTEQVINIPLGIRWSSLHGVSFIGGGGFEVELYPHLSIGPVSLDAIQVQLSANASPASLTLATGLSISGVLGPLEFIVEGIGMQLDGSFGNGNAGPFGVTVGFKYPTGIGLSIDTQGFTGGGFLFFDKDKGEYAGGLEISFQDTISLKLIGILNTIMPDGTNGFSLILIITAEFTPIQLGFGFTLNGVGGLVGINRSVEIDVLQSGVKDGSLNSILFPEDIVANATQIVTDIKKVFPVYEGQYAFGPMAEIGWGAPTLISLQLGLIIELPDPIRIAILGVLRCVLPDEDFKLLNLQVNFLGVIDFEKKYISFDASLYDSKLLTFTLTGDMALRLSWGSEPVFVLSVGGFHPSYEPPANLGLGDMERLSINLFSGNPRLRIENYFAVTSNTAQFGANGQLYVSKAGFDVEGYIGFDVLFQFSPFYFIAQVSASLSVSYEGEDILSIHLSLSLDGPTPWHAKGKASFSFLVFDVTVSISETFGDEKIQRLPRLMYGRCSKLHYRKKPTGRLKCLPAATCW